MNNDNIEEVEIVYEESKRICSICGQLIDANEFTKPDEDGDSWCKGCDNDARYER